MLRTIHYVLLILLVTVTAEALVPAGGQLPRRLGFHRHSRPFRNQFETLTRVFNLKEDVVSSSECNEQVIPAFKGDEGSQQKPNLLPLFLVPLVWGTYSPIVKSVYSSSTVLAPPVLIFNTLSYLVSFSSLLGVSLLAGQGRSSSINETSITDDSSGKDNVELRVGAELGMYLFVGSMLQVFGIQQVAATKAAVLVQCTTIIVPLLESLLYRKKISKRLWSACSTALFGVLLLTLDRPGALLSLFSGAGWEGGSLEGMESGDIFIICATFFYSMHVVRLSRFAAQTKPLKLARYKSGTELAAATIVVSTVLLLASLSPDGGNGGGYGALGAEIEEYFTQLRNLPSLSSQSPVLFGIMWNGALATALTTYLQTLGQRGVTATTANIVYSSQPIWASLLSIVFLHERLSSGNLLGAAVLAFAVLLAATDPDAE